MRTWLDPLRALPSRPLGRASAFVGVLALVLASADVAGAQPAAPPAAEESTNDAVAVAAEALDLMTKGKQPEALVKLHATLKGCKGCDPETRGIVLGTLGLVYGSQGDLERARALFEMALREDPSLQLDPAFASKDVQRVFVEAQREVKRQPEGPGKGATRVPPGGEQLGVLAEAEKLLAAGNWSDCMGTLIGGLGDEGFAAGKLLLARCEDAGGLLLEARKDAEAAAKLADEEGQTVVAGKVTELLEKLDNDTPRIIVIVPASVDNPEIQIDGVKFDKETAKKGIPRNPGKATIVVTGKKAGYPFKFETVERVDRGEGVTVDVAEQGGAQSSAVQACLANAKTAAEVALCLETGGKGRGLTFRGGLEVSSYNDTTHVDAVSPGVKLAFENPTEGWLVGGGALVDVVSAASPDIVATASRRFDQARFAGNLGGDVKVGLARVGASGAISWENDYVGRSVGVRGSADVLDKRITPTLAYQFGWDSIGMVDTSYEEFESKLYVHTFDLGASAVLSTDTLLVAGGTFVYEDGDQSKPYRHVPMFSPDVVATVPKGATGALVGASRLPIAPREQLPLERARGALSIGVRHRFETSTLRVDERLYADNWGLLASTTDARFLLDLESKTRVGPHLRAHLQKGVSFWERAYTAEVDSSGALNLPEFRAGDRELGPMFGVTVGGSIRQELGETLAIGLALDGVYTQFLDHIFVFDRWAIFTASTLEVVLE